MTDLYHERRKVRSLRSVTMNPRMNLGLYIVILVEPSPVVPSVDNGVPTVEFGIIPFFLHVIRTFTGIFVTLQLCL
jgi:hypothetical protein